MEFSVLGLVVAAPTPSKFLAYIQFQSIPWFFLDVCKYSGSSHELVSSLYTLLTWPFTSCLLSCWLQCHACGHVLAMFTVHLRAYKLYSPCKHQSDSHTKLYAMSWKCHHSHSMIYLKCRTCHSHPLVSHIGHMVSCWFELSCHQVMLSVCSQGHAYMSSLAHTLSHFFRTYFDQTTLHQLDLH